MSKNKKDEKYRSHLPGTPFPPRLPVQTSPLGRDRLRTPSLPSLMRDCLGERWGGVRIQGTGIKKQPLVHSIQFLDPYGLIDGCKAEGNGQSGMNFFQIELKEKALPYRKGFPL